MKAALNELLPIDQLGALNEDLGGGRAWTEHLALAVTHPGDGIVGLGKGLAIEVSDQLEHNLKVASDLAASEVHSDAALISKLDPEGSAALKQQAETMHRKTDGIDLPAPGDKEWC
ncbi:hypothetical protein [Allohahella marinimesophila]|uniref:Uncharacterized protein n=1 Tax=Allohahella marinimesophila TaxID=1054972 RepID=A0ABP7NRR3_9GAMM